MAAARLTHTWLCQLRLRHLRRLYATSNVAYDEAGALLALEPIHENLSDKMDNVAQVNILKVNSKLKELVQTGHLNNARQVFDKLPHRDVVSWTIMISGYVNGSNSSEALSLFSKMWVERNIAMDPFVLSIALKACGFSLNVKHGELLHAYSVKTSLLNSVFVGSALLDMYTKTGKIWDGCRVFDEMPLRNVVSWTAIITGLVRAGYNNEGLRYFSEMWQAGEEYDAYTIAIALKACADDGALNYGREIHTQAMKKGFDVSSFVANTLATMYNKCGKLEYGLCLFERMSTRDVVSWTTIITTYVQMGQADQAIQAFLRMRESEVCPNEYTFAAVISACVNLVRTEWGEQLHGHVLLVGVLDCSSVANSIVTMYSRCGQLNSAARVFHEMTIKDIVSWSTIIAGYAQGGCGEQAFKYISMMRKEGPKPTEFALASVLSVCGNMAILDEGKQFHAHVLSIGLEHTCMIRSALINMYSKCGNIEEAWRIFDGAANADIVSWTAMINGYAEHGHCKEAINLFEKIPRVGIRPDRVTFIGVLTACSHAGLVDLGFHYFNSMREKYRIIPSKEHYGCMIDLLCRAGRLSDAEGMIRSMPYNQDDIVWSTLLRACRVHGDIECGRRAAQQILELDPNCAGTHITMANIYAAKGKWREAADVRKLMKSKGVIKEPGWSWIKVKDHVSEFVAGDQSHPEAEDIYDILNLFASREDITVMELGYVLFDADNMQNVELSFGVP
ncbi:putative pentatricopeptide repeat-containing protein At3g47840 [Diospyros lotus]|uniref:putative pentatricopeptide repeat-containing protein At3g47840 n=1 Tax=Diospyros lotus TaxID=55363 RepID=UPI00224E8E12|nr:putative pentatricopeptide repeat-containing protein At3g47840 [Diospyros lotus]XP_052175104.1 putative pentatricopeptide repeat-containing protein At3g47840 [Diospyros lotus]XP_052175105.1 putative pentatricopeptide repeat-containing protein At3g47840 [Diospyros lotus]XP_052175107.1 putative pentatricopeptide repeat-containing protein At3g47840 [Diospyros lotus]XP_052175108.1 putative pentatricopeptide repeat-containing protein At3g47840 [Diospyros lotus]XP_052175109.1 putative pentatricop